MKSLYLVAGIFLLAINKPSGKPGDFNTIFNHPVYRLDAGVSKDTTVQRKQLEALYEQHQNLQTSYTRIQYTFLGTTVSFILLLIICVRFEIKRRFEVKKIRHDKDVFVKDLIAEYDHKIIQLMIVKADYEEIIKNQEDKGDPGKK